MNNKTNSHELKKGNLFVMTATGHALVGTILAAKISNPVLLVLVGVASHFVCDAVPHWDSGTNGKKKTRKRLFIEAVADVLIGFFVSYFTFHSILHQTNDLNLLLGILSAQLPDWISIPPFIFGLKLPFIDLIDKIQIKVNQRLDKPWGIVTQVGFVLLVYITLFKIF